MPLLAAAAAPTPLFSFCPYRLCVPFPYGGGARAPLRRGDLVIRMGGGPRTFPGGVSKWQWKRMQARKAKQLLKARLARERQLYEMRKRAEMRDAVAHLERPWDSGASSAAAPSAAALAPNLLSVAADDQLKALADRFHRPGGVDLWNDRDGPQVFATPDTGTASARFFPRNAVHSVQPYGLLGAGAGDESAPAVRGGAADAIQWSDGAQGVRENAAENGGDELAVEFIERGGVWEPVNGGDDDNYDDYDDDDDVSSGLEGLGGVDGAQQRRAMVGRNGRKGGVARWDVASAMALSSDDVRAQHGNGFFSDSEGGREDIRSQRWQARSGDSTRKRPIGRGKTLNTQGRSSFGVDRMEGGGSLSDSEVIPYGFEPKWRARNREGTMNGMGRWNPSDEGRGRGNVPRNDGVDNEFDSNSERGRGARENRLSQRWQQRSSDTTRNHTRNALSTERSSNIRRDQMEGVSSFSDSEVTRNGFEPKWRTRNRERTMNGAGRWKPPNQGSGNVPRNDWIGNEFYSNSDSGRDGRFEPKWKTQNRFNRNENRRGRHERNYSSNATNTERPGRYMNNSNGDKRRDQFGNRFASDLEEPIWKPRRNSGPKTNNNGYREYNDDMNGRFRRGGNGDDMNGRFRRGGGNGDNMNGRFRRGGNGDDTNGGFRRGGNGEARWDANPMNNHRGDVSENGRHGMIEGRRHRGDRRSLLPTSELHNSWRERELHNSWRERESDET